MMKEKYLILVLSVMIFMSSCTGSGNKFSIADYGVKPDTRENISAAAQRLIDDLKNRTDTAHIKVIFPKGTYHFYEDSAFVREYYISNHDQDNPKKVGLALENLKNITIDGMGSTFIFHGRMIPISIINSENISLKNIYIDFEVPALRQLNVIEVNKETDEIVAEIYPNDNYRIDDGKLIILGETYELTPI